MFFSMPISLACILAVADAVGQHGPSSLPEFRALSQIESGDRDFKIGRSGEVSRYQIKPSTWKSYDVVPYNVHHWSRHEYASYVAMQHAAWLKKNFQSSTGYNKYPNPIEFYCLWNLGLEGFRKYSFSVQAVPHKTRNAAMRYNNLILLYSGKN